MLALLFMLSAFASIEGQWYTSDKTGQIEIYREGDKYFGKIIGGEKRGDGYDRKNPDEKLRNREVLGLTILTDLRQDKDDKKLYHGGKIYDPDSGNTYKCKATLSGDDELELRGYIGISLFGRSETWTRKKSDVEWDGRLLKAQDVSIVMKPCNEKLIKEFLAADKSTWKEKLPLLQAEASMACKVK